MLSLVDPKDNPPAHKGLMIKWSITISSLKTVVAASVCFEGGGP